MLPRVSAALTKFVAPIASSRKQEKIQQDDAEQRRSFQRYNPKKDSSSNPGKDQGSSEHPQGQAQPAPNESSHSTSPGGEPHHLRLVEGGGLPPPLAPRRARKPDGEAGDRPGLSVAHSFLELLNRFTERKSSLFRWFGQQSYQAAERKQKKAARFRKGIMLDEKIE